MKMPEAHMGRVNIGLYCESARISMTKRGSESYGRICCVELVVMFCSATNFVAFLAGELY